MDRIWNWVMENPGKSALVVLGALAFLIFITGGSQ